MTDTWEARDFEITEAMRMIARSLGIEPERMTSVLVTPQHLRVSHKAVDDLGEMRLVEREVEWRWVP